VHALAPGSVWKVFQLVREVFEQFGARPVSWGGLTALGMLSSFCSLLHSRVALLHWLRGSVLWLRGSLHMCKGSSLWCSSFGSVVCALCLSMILSRMCRAVALA
jgi:hypothetical protein